MNTSLEHVAVGPKDLATLTQHVEETLDASHAQGVAIEVLALRSMRVSHQVSGESVDSDVPEPGHYLYLAVYEDQCKGEIQVALDEAFNPHEAVAQALAIARLANPDAHQGPADADSLAAQYPDLDLYHECPLSQESLKELVRICDATGLQTDERIVGSRGSMLNLVSQAQVFGNSHGFLGGYAFTTYQLSSYMRGAYAGVQRTAGESVVGRSLADIGEPGEIGSLAARRVIDYLGSNTLQVDRCAMVFSPRTSVWLLGAFIDAIGGEAISQGRSVLAGTLGTQLFPRAVSIQEFPHQVRGIGSVPFDLEGCAVAARTFVEQGRLQSYALDATSARRLGMSNTGNASIPFEQARNLSFVPGQSSQSELLAQMGSGVLVSEVLPPEVDLQSGAFSMKAIGLWVENGEIQYPLNPFVITADLKEIFGKIQAIGNDLEEKARIKGLSVLVDALTIRH
ncbi:TldD/PmbA family protein [Pseudomonas sp. BBP2017]|uniref:TldD/PmbA family protein n=1 Tax=Pseudomonas sp. BBP2017 TaxID=2109731 RepID=UPI000D122392|nr:metallopeptidase TldD-related protein [Pseudomonas sp. BBP2017]PSS58002.1 hypothetical protein C6382_05715 [Pseudomonas sp. BBP2017]